MAELSVETSISKLKSKRVKIGTAKDETTGLPYRYVDRSKADYLGLKSLAHLDYLVNHCNYRLIRL